MSDTCEKVDTCPIFQQGVLFSENTGVTYRALYCQKSGKYLECKRYLVAKRGYKVPTTIMPNSRMTVDEIINLIEKSQGRK